MDAPSLLLPLSSRYAVKKKNTKGDWEVGIYPRQTLKSGGMLKEKTKTGVYFNRGFQSSHRIWVGLDNPESSSGRQRPDTGRCGYWRCCKRSGSPFQIQPRQS